MVTWEWVTIKAPNGAKEKKNQEAGIIGRRII